MDVATSGEDDCQLSDRFILFIERFLSPVPCTKGDVVAVMGNLNFTTKSTCGYKF